MSKNKTYFFSILFFNISIFSFAQKCNCESNFNWLKTTIENNDAGFQYVIDTKGKSTYENLNKLTIDSIRKTKNIEDCHKIMSNWLTFFRKGHLYLNLLTPSQNNIIKSNNQEQLSIDLNQFKQHLDKAVNSDIEGIWEIGYYKIGILKQDNQYKGFIIDSANPDWKKGNIKLIIAQDLSAIYYQNDKTVEYIEKIKKLSNNYLSVGDQVLKRVYPKTSFSNSKDQYYNLIYAPKPFIEQINNTTLLLRIPTFNQLQKKDIDSVLVASRNLLNKTPNLIIDIRDNGGGSDASYKELIPYLYTNPIREIQNEIYSTKLNNERALEFSTHPNRYGLSKSEADEWAEDYKTLQEHLGQFVKLAKDSIKIINDYKSLSFPKNVGIIINKNNGSTAEQFILLAKQSKKVKLFGTTTAGVLDISNMNFTESPCKEFKLWYSLSKSFRIPDFAIDGKGIQPDYFIDKSIADEEWVNYVSGVMNFK